MATDPTMRSSQCSPRSGRLLDARPVWLPTLAALFFAVLTAMLGQWQWHKAELKQALGSSYDRASRQAPLTWAEATALGESALYRRVRLRGEFAAGYQVLLDNRVLRGRAGYHVLEPLRLAPGGAVLVNRGWLAVADDRTRLPAIATPEGGQVVEGILVHARGRYLELAAAGEPERLWQNLDLDRYRAWFGGELSDWLLLRTDPDADGLVRDWPEPDAGIARHRSYAVQWYSLCALIVGLWCYFVLFRRGRTR